MRILFALLALVLPLTTEAGPVARQDDLKEKTRRLKGEVTRLRGLEFPKAVEVGVYSKPQLLKFIEAEFEKELPRHKAKKYEKTLVHFGLIPAGLDLYDSLIVLFSESIAGFYHPKTKEMKLVAPGAEDEQGKMMGLDMTGITLVHELTHAAQDQNYDLVTVPVEEETNDDLIAAIKGLIEGDASIVGYKYGFKATFNQVIRLINQQYKTGMLPGKAGRLPRYLRETLTFSYGYGCDFVLACLKGFGNDWGKISKMYDDLPSSTEQVLHPEKYWKERDNPTLVTFPRLGKEWELLSDNVHGEFSIRVLLRELGASSSEAAKAAAGWDGDRYHVYEKDGKVSSVWYSTWDSVDDAKEFYSAYRVALGKKHAVGERVKGQAGPDSESATWPAAGGRQVKISRRGKDVLVLEGDTSLVALAPRYWKEAKKEELKKVERFLRGRWTCPNHPKVEKDLNSYCPECTTRLVRKRRDY